MWLRGREKKRWRRADGLGRPADFAKASAEGGRPRTGASAPLGWGHWAGDSGPASLGMEHWADSTGLAVVGVRAGWG
jgi:hypothetical protein